MDKKRYSPKRALTLPQGTTSRKLSLTDGNFPNAIIVQVKNIENDKVIRQFPADLLIEVLKKIS